MVKQFNKGDFIKYKSYANNEYVAFGIFEGVDMEPEYQYAKKYSLVLYYDSHKYCSQMDNEKGWGYQEVLDVGTKQKKCEKTVDTLEENAYWSLCTPSEKENALHILAQYGYEWDEESFSLIDAETREVVHQIIMPKLEYNGDMIKPICNDLRDKLKQSVISKGKTTHTNNGYYYNNEYGRYPYEQEYWD